MAFLNPPVPASVRGVPATKHHEGNTPTAWRMTFMPVFVRWTLPGLPIWTHLIWITCGVWPGSLLKAAEIAASPPKFEIQIGEELQTQTLRIYNLGKSEIAFDVTLANWILDENNQVQVVAPTEQSLDQWMLINPLRISIPGKDSRAIRFTIKPRVAPEPGEHRAMIYLTETDARPGGNQVTVKARFGVAVYGYVGEVERNAALHNIQLLDSNNPPILGFDITNKGNAHVRLAGQYAIWQADRFPGTGQTGLLPNLNQKDTALPTGIIEAGLLTERPILPGYRRTLLHRVLKELPPGDYVIDLNGSVASQEIDQAFPFSLAGPGRSPKQP